MATVQTCDLCGARSKGREMFVLGPRTAVPGEFEEVCEACLQKHDPAIGEIYKENEEAFKKKVTEYFRSQRDMLKIGDEKPKVIAFPGGLK